MMFGFGRRALQIAIGSDNGNYVYGVLVRKVRIFGEGDGVACGQLGCQGGTAEVKNMFNESIGSVATEEIG